MTADVLPLPYLCGPCCDRRNRGQGGSAVFAHWCLGGETHVSGVSRLVLSRFGCACEENAESLLNTNAPIRKDRGISFWSIGGWA